MKRTVIGIVIFSLLFAFSCKKSSNNPVVVGPGGSWTFYGTAYKISSGTFTPYGYGWNMGLFNGIDSVFPPGYVLTIRIQFPDSTPPTQGGTYTVINGMYWPVATVGQGQVIVNLSGYSSAEYLSTGNGSNQKVMVSVSPTGKLSVSGTGIEMINLSSPYDSTALNFNITKTQ